MINGIAQSLVQKYERASATAISWYTRFPVATVRTYLLKRYPNNIRDGKQFKKIGCELHIRN